VGFFKDLFKRVVNRVPGVCVECDPYEELASTKGVHYNHAKITHKEAVRKMAEYGMSAQYNIYDKRWVVKYGTQVEVSESFREAVEAIKVK
jgi:hypothetical protein